MASQSHLEFMGNLDVRLSICQILHDIALNSSSLALRSALRSAFICAVPGCRSSWTCKMPSISSPEQLLHPSAHDLGVVLGEVASMTASLFSCSRRQRLFRRRSIFETQRQSSRTSAAHQRYTSSQTYKAANI